MEHCPPEGQRSALTGLGLFQRKPLKKALAPLRLWLRKAESFQDVWKLGLCGSTSWAGSAGQARLWPTGSCLAQGALDPGRRTGNAVFPLFRHSRGAKSRQGMRRELPWLSRLPARETWEVIGALGQKANSLDWAPEDGWAVSVFGTAKSPGLDCVLLSSPNMQHTSPCGNGSGTSACLLRVPEGLGRGEVFNQGGWSLLLPFCCCAPACSVTFPK